MRPIVQLALAATTLATLLACSAPRYTTDTDVGTVIVDLGEGAHVLDLHLELSLDDPEKMSCRKLLPSLQLEWSGDEGDVHLRIAAGDDTWDEDTLVEDGLTFTSVGGTFRRCAFDATVQIDSPEPLLGAISVKGTASGGDVDARGTVHGEVTVTLLDDAE